MSFIYLVISNSWYFFKRKFFTISSILISNFSYLFNKLLKFSFVIIFIKLITFAFNFWLSYNLKYTGLEFSEGLQFTYYRATNKIIPFLGIENLDLWIKISPFICKKLLKIETVPVSILSIFSKMSILFSSSSFFYSSHFPNTPS